MDTECAHASASIHTFLLRHLRKPAVIVHLSCHYHRHSRNIPPASNLHSTCHIARWFDIGRSLFLPAVTYARMPANRSISSSLRANAPGGILDFQLRTATYAVSTPYHPSRHMSSSNVSQFRTLVSTSRRATRPALLGQGLVLTRLGIWMHPPASQIGQSA